MELIDRYAYFGWNPLPAVERIAITGAPPFLRGVTAAFAADFHIRDSTPDGYIEKISEMLKNTGADLLLLGGDYGESINAARRLFDALNSLSFRYGAFAAVGNNDRERFPEISQLRKIISFPLLINQSEPVSIGGGTLLIGGVDELKYGTADARGLFQKMKNSYAILLSHYPTIPDFGTGARANLILSGHTHGGQVNLFGFTSYTLGIEKSITAHIKGMTETDGMKLFVSTGIGMSKLPIRICCAPRIHVFAFN